MILSKVKKSVHKVHWRVKLHKYIQTKAMELLSLSLKLFSFKRITFKECKGIKILLACQ